MGETGQGRGQLDNRPNEDIVRSSPKKGDYNLVCAENFQCGEELDLFLFKVTSPQVAAYPQEEKIQVPV